jgi:hypothetical protein
MTGDADIGIMELSRLSGAVMGKGEAIAMAEIKFPIQVDLPDDWIEQIVNRLRNDPEAEWVEVVRCKDCKHHWTHSCMDAFPREICDLDQTFYDSNIDYCSLAERRTDEQTD